ncbi:hypothetical protein D3C75_917890 [compost metagenome]
MSSVYVVNALHPGVDNKIYCSKIILHQLLLNIKLVKPPVQLLNDFLRLHIGGYGILEYGGQKHAEQ